MKKRIDYSATAPLLFAFFIFSSSWLNGQFTLAENGIVFPQNQVTSIYISIHPDSLADMLLEENLYSDHEYPATFTFTSENYSETIENIGFRLRGNTSREAAKKSFKVSFNTFQNIQWQGLEKLNLNAYHNDPSLMRAKLCWDMYREAGLPGSRTSYTKLFINEEFRGIYLNTEHIDEEFTKNTIDEQGDGNLYKCLYPADLNYLGNNQNDYKEEFFGRRIYELKINEWQDDYSDLAQLISRLHFSTDENFYCEIKEIFDIETYVKYAALEILQGHWDGYIFNKNNFYLYHNEMTNQLIWMPYDLDNTLGIDWFGETWSNKNPYQFNNQSRILYERMLDNDFLRNLFSQYLSSYLDQFFSEQWYASKIETYHALLSPIIDEDIYYTLDYGFSPEDFENSDTQAFGGHVTQGLNAYFTQRRLSALSQIEEVSSATSFIAHISDNGPSPSIPIIKAYAETSNPVLCSYQIDDGISNEVEMLDNGVFPDELAGDNLFTCFVAEEALNKIEYQISLQGMDQNCIASRTIWMSNSPLSIQFNEVMAQNTNIYPDEFGEYGDWIEIHNPGPTNVNMSGMFITDEQDNKDKWALPSQILQVGTFRVFYADNQPEQGPLHTNFQLSDNGESLWMYRLESGAFREVTGMAFPTLVPGTSYGRATEASDVLVVFEVPTPLGPNGVSSVAEADGQVLSVYPNPADEYVFFSKKQEHIKLYDAMGKLVLEEYHTQRIDVSRLVSGLYVLSTEENTYRLIVR